MRLTNFREGRLGPLGVGAIALFFLAFLDLRFSQFCPSSSLNSWPFRLFIPRAPTTRPSPAFTLAHPWLRSELSQPFYDPDLSVLNLLPTCFQYGSSRTNQPEPRYLGLSPHPVFSLSDVPTRLKARVGCVCFTTPPPILFSSAPPRPAYESLHLCV